MTAVDHPRVYAVLRQTSDVKPLNCPHWPECACPGGTTRPECPVLKSCKGAQ